MSTAPHFGDYTPPIDPRNTLQLVKSGEVEAPEEFDSYPSPAMPMGAARRLVSDLFTTAEHKTLVFWRGDWWQWQRSSWARADSDLEVKGPIWHRLEEVTFSSKDDEPKPWAPTPAKVSNIMEPLAILTRIPDATPAPVWLDGTAPAPLVSMNNGLLNIRTRELTGHTPAFFNTWALEFDYIPDAQCPIWDRFCAQVFAHDPKGALLLQEFAGYLISGRGDLHKALLIVGPPRGGKGTISRTLHALIGAANVVSPSLSNLGSEFGLAPLIGKPLAVVEDARADDDRRNNTTVERLLNIVGQDAVSVNRKNKDYWHGTLPTRFILISNETPRFLDSSGAIANRFMSVRLKASFADNPDTHLGEKLHKELPGIFNWALAGLRRLGKQGHFTRPATMDEMDDLLSDMASPVAQFLDEYYIVTGAQADVEKVTDAFGQYKMWAELQGMRPMVRDTFVQRFQAVNPGIEYKNTRLNGRPGRWFFGIRAKTGDFSE
ncbi:DNA primase family protein [Corynebacterium flavescens]|uniref:DNA primase family protein n=1 Tax=Corynebacterium flavescens TaxID=28028 RepID=UPI003FD511FF